MKTILNLSNWSYEDFLKFLSLIRAGDQRGTFASIRKIIVGWDYDVDLNDEDCMEELGLVEGTELLSAVNTTIEEFGKTTAITDFKVNLKPWKNRDFNAFLDAQSASNATVLETMVKQVVAFPNSDKSLNAIDGILCMRAINAAYTKLLTGKN